LTMANDPALSILAPHAFPNHHPQRKFALRCTIKSAIKTHHQTHAVRA
jgi:hypothetical protein